MEKKARDEATARVKDFYDGPADTVYTTTWGENLHLGVPRQGGGSHKEAMEHTTELMAQLLLEMRTTLSLTWAAATALQPSFLPLDLDAG